MIPWRDTSGIAAAAALVADRNIRIGNIRMATFPQCRLTEVTKIDILPPTNGTVLPPGLGPGPEEAAPFALSMPGNDWGNVRQ